MRGRDEGTPRRAECHGGGDTRPAGLPPAAVDADVPSAVGRVLGVLLDEQVCRAGRIDATFARDVAGRVRSFTLEGGKRTRSQFLWWGLRACGDGPGARAVGTVLRVAAAVELLQTCALVHDDAMDRSPVRRGRPSVHVEFAERFTAPGREARAARFGAAAAVLTGDLALAWADDTLAAAGLDGRCGARVREIWQAMRGEMVAGQYLDLYGQISGSRSAALATRISYLKSARYSVERPLALGAALADAEEATAQALCAAGRCAGVAFQFQDDLLGVFGDPERTGKPTGDDIREGKLTTLLTVARARAARRHDRAALAVLDRCVGDRGLDDAGLERVRAVFVATGARDEVAARIRRLVTRSFRHLDSVPLDAFAAARLRRLISAVAGVGEDPDGPGPADGADGGSDCPSLAACARGGRDR
ncbi:polyprenyl synthetase family protein [Streptomyces lydicus]|uniref:polyprenyl synthetase family protein n=1 Tax=Streptomyces lydicus TaxID=47763 RepID=UPI0033F900E7